MDISFFLPLLSKTNFNISVTSDLEAAIASLMEPILTSFISLVALYVILKSGGLHSLAVDVAGALTNLRVLEVIM